MKECVAPLLGWKMPYAFQGHIVVLINQNTASDAEFYPAS